MKRTARHLLALLLAVTTTTTCLKAQLQQEAAYALIRRVLPAAAATQFTVAPLAAAPGKDAFALESRNNKIVLYGNNGVAIASALYYYLNEYCHCQITWNGTNLKLPAKLPVVKSRIQKNSPYHYRYNLNYCTYNYSMSWWNWERWEQELDWMALHGINMPLAITGQEYTWHELYRQMGFTEEELASFFSGPAYFGWFWMGNLDGWGGPLPYHWMTSHYALQKKILQRARALGMTPVLPAFTGHVPAAFKTHFPQAKLKQTNWKNGFADTYILNPEDSLFAVIGKKFLNLQTRLFGTDHLYSADTFNENEPPSDDPGYLGALSARLYEGMKAADPKAIWVMQGWLFYSDRKFWKAPQIKALLDAVPNEHMLLLDLAAEIEPIWKRTDAFYGKPWIWNMLNNFGGNVNLFGRMSGVASGPALALHDSLSGRMEGIGLTMEAIAQNPVIYELMMSHTWQDTPIALHEWLTAYVRNRYGAHSDSLVHAWELLEQTAYNGQAIRDGAESIITGRPTLDSTTVWTRTKLNYAPKDLLPVWDIFIQSARKPAPTEGFVFDLVDITRQVLANYALPLQRRWVKAFETGDSLQFEQYYQQYLALISDMDELLATHKDFLLGDWLATARACGITPAEKDLYEVNARDLVTLWGDANSPLHEYSNRQWSGLLNDFYKVRWEKYRTVLRTALAGKKAPEQQQFEKDIQQWEWQWVNTHSTFPAQPSGNSVAIALALYQKYRSLIETIYP